MSTTPTPTKRVRTKTTIRVRPEVRAEDSRPDALPSPDMVNVFEEALSFPTRLLAKAWVRNVAYDKKVWLDVDLLGKSGEALHSETLPLQYLEPAGGTGDFFLADVAVPPPTWTAGRASAHELRYRLYYQVEGQVFTDGICHHHRL
jgi:hypothetical protein